MKKALFFAGLAMLASLTIGCSGGGGNANDGIPAADKAAAADANKLAVSVNGDYDKLTPEQQKQFITLAGGEGQARKMVNMMAHPPHSSQPGAASSGAGPSAIPSGPHPPGGG